MTCIIGKQQSSISSCSSILKGTVTVISSGIPHNQLELQISLSEYFNQHRRKELCDRLLHLRMSLLEKINESENIPSEPSNT